MQQFIPKMSHAINTKNVYSSVMSENKILLNTLMRKIKKKIFLKKKINC